MLVISSAEMASIESQLIDEHRNRAGGVAEIEMAVEGVEGVRSELDAGADLLIARRALQHGDLESPLRASATAAASPPMPPPAMMIGSLSHVLSLSLWLYFLGIFPLAARARLAARFCAFVARVLRLGRRRDADQAGFDFLLEPIDVVVEIDQHALELGRFLRGHAAGDDLFIICGERHQPSRELRALGRQRDLEAALVVLRPVARQQACAAHLRDDARQRGHIGRGEFGDLAEAQRMALLRQRGQHAVHRQRQLLVTDDADEEVSHPHAEPGEQIGQRI